METPASVRMPFSRRDFLTGASKLSVASIAMLAGISPKVFAADHISAPYQDIVVLNEILGTEHEGIGTYQIFADGDVFKKDIRKTALIFQGHHKAHRDLLITTIQKLGGVPVKAKTNDEYAVDLDTAAITTQTDALTLLTKLEVGAANAYIGMLPFTTNRELAKMAGRITADEVMHWAVLMNTLQEPFPTSAMSFGA